MSSSWLKVSCVALGFALAVSAISAAAAPTTHSSLSQSGFAANSPILVTPPPTYKMASSPILVTPPPTYKNSPILVTPPPTYKMASSPILVTPPPTYKNSPILVTPPPTYKMA